ncbi:MFS transporter [Streptomyces sp. NPDC101118]|uniref:MFS transporter n=1 Tax=Streptomyces sp. NPDC101118 TaxID=3366109 RepID=UPI00381EEF4F
MTTSALPPAPPATGRSVGRRALVAGGAGNFVEWYEFGVYGYFAPVLAAAFFPAAGGGGSGPLVATYAAFALAFFFRPLGALLLGRLGDRAGRRPALVTAVALMTLATTAIGLLPTHAAAGVAAPVALTALRVLQGISAGGEFGGAVSVLTEFAPPRRRGRYGSWQSCTVALGLLAGAGTAAALATALPEAALYAWGWRVAFLLALPLGLATLVLRLRLPETPEFRPDPCASPDRRLPARDVLLGAGRIVGWSGAGYAFLVVLPSHLQTALGASFRDALLATVLANTAFAAAIVPAGALSDRLGRRAVLLTGTVLVIVLAVPLFAVLRDPGQSAAAKAAAVLLAGALVGLLAGPGPAMLAEMFPARVRCTGLGTAYALANALFAGCAGLVITRTAEWTGRTDVPALYAAGACALSLPALCTLGRDDHRRPLR